ncbi:MAG: multidrug efflux pump subunit AcrB [Halieaceae bacterium]
MFHNPPCLWKSSPTAESDDGLESCNAFHTFFHQQAHFCQRDLGIGGAGGAIAYQSLPVGQYPDIAPPTIQISAAYPGASTETISGTVAAAIEEEINGVALAEPRLPAPVRRLGISTVQSNPDALMVVHMYSPDASRDQLYISNYVRLQMRDRLQRLQGVGQIQAFGFREYSMRVWIDPDIGAMLDLTGTDIVNALCSNNVEVTAGVLDAPPSEA